MQKVLTLKKIILKPKLKLNRVKKIYDKEWDMFFSSEEEKRQFKNKMVTAEVNIKKGNYYTQQEMEEYIAQEFGIQI